ncbi:MAG: TrkH family potassium uptake protein [Lachnospiraceae bacterium]|jgi:trk system potassium uptake protein TrkH|nr:TrkH family potassium uptake protein [Lachnospiraceae bacterium]
MNIAIIIYFLGWILNVEAVLMLLPCITALIYQESSGFYFLITLVICGALGAAITFRKPKNTVFYAKEGFVCVALSWIVLSIFGALPFYLSREIPVFEDALFEVISGFTTTGSSILTDVEALSRCMLLWRSFTHWVGGMGVIVFMLAVLPLAGGGYNMHIMKAESPGPSVGKLVPKVRQTAKILYLLYFGITVTQITLLLLSGMPLFDTICLSFGTAGTGGFGILNDSIASYTYLQQSIITLFMILFGINFNVYYLFLIRKPKDALCCEEARVYIGIIAVSTLIIGFNIRSMYPNLITAFHHAAFQVGTIITTTGFATADFDLWPELSKTILVLLMFCGACAGSTGGGMKVSRILIAVKQVKKELGSLVHPQSVKILRLEGKKLEHNVIRSANGYFLAYALIFAGSVLLISIDQFDFTTNVTAVAATFNNIGPGLAKVGPTCNWSGFSPFSKYIFMFDMLAGRLEIFPMLLLFAPGTWKKGF